jgi:hypothetical protein
MRKLRRAGALALALVGFLFVQTTSALAGAEYHAEAKSGQLTRIRVFYNCLPGGYPWGEQGAHIDYGTITVRKTTWNTQGKSCGAFVGPVPANEIWYTSPPGFKGVDRVMFWGRLASMPPVIIDVDVK